MTARRMLFWAHLGVGLVVSLVVVFLAVTGSLMAFERQVEAWAERGARVPVHAGMACVAPSAVLAQAAASAGAAPVSYKAFANPQRPTEVGFQKDVVLLLDPCTGHVVGTGRLRGFFAKVEQLHRFVAWGGTRHEGLRAVKNAANLGFAFLMVSGVVLWVPRRLQWNHVSRALVPRWTGAGRPLEWSLHTVVGFWIAVPLLCVSLTGAVMAYPWANALLFRAAGEAAPAGRPGGGPERGGHGRDAEHRAEQGLGQGSGQGPGRERQAGGGHRQAQSGDGAPNPGQYAGLDPLLARATAQDPRWKSLMLRLPAEHGREVSVMLDEGEGGDPRQKSQLTLGRRDASVVRWERFDGYTRGRQWRMKARFLHTGELFGLAGQAVALVSMLGALLLVGTGISLSVRRYAAWQRRRARAA